MKEGSTPGHRDGMAKKVCGRIDVQPWEMVELAGVAEYLVITRAKNGNKREALCWVRNRCHSSRRNCREMLADGCGKSSST
jgi:hypothetical protein